MAPKPTVKPKGFKGLLKNKKVLYIGGGVLLLLLLLYYRSRKGASPATTPNTGLIPLTTVTPQQAASAGTPSPNSPPSAGLDQATLDALGMGNKDYVTNTDLKSQLSDLQSNIQASVAGVTFYSPGQTPAAPKTAKAAATSAVSNTATKGKVASIRYYTYAPGKAPKGQVKNQVPALKKGQTLHYTKGKGYYVS